MLMSDAAKHVEQRLQQDPRSSLHTIMATSSGSVQRDAADGAAHGAAHGAVDGAAWPSDPDKRAADT